MRGTCVYLASLLASATVAGPLPRPSPLLSTSQTERLGIAAREQTQDLGIYLTLATSILSLCPQGPSPECWQKLAETHPGIPDDHKGGGGAVKLRRDNDGNDGGVPPENRRRMHGAEGMKLLDLTLRAMAYCANMPFPECWRRLEAAYPGFPGDFHERIGAVPGAGGVAMQDAPGDNAPEDDSSKDDPPKNDAPEDGPPKTDPPESHPPESHPPESHPSEASPPEPSAPAPAPPKISPPKINPPRIDLPEVAPPVFSPPKTATPECEPPSRYNGITLIVRSLRHCPGSGMPCKECWALLKKAMPDLPAEFKLRPGARRAVTTDSFFVSDVEDVDRRGQVS